MVEMSTSGSGEGPGWVTGRGYSTADPYPMTYDLRVPELPAGQGLHGLRDEAIAASTAACP